MRIALCDDEKSQNEFNSRLINKWAAIKDIDVDIEAFSSAEEFLFHWSEGLPYDLAFFDIKMKKMSGVDLAKIIRKTDQDLLIVFVTGLAEYVFDGYDVSAINYLLKPYKEKELFKTLDRALVLTIAKENGSILIPQEGKIIRLPYSEILYMEVRGHYFNVYTKNLGQYRIKKQMNEMLANLDKHMFTQCHRSFIVNISQISKLTHTEITLKTGMIAPLSQSYIQVVTQKFIKYHHGYEAKGEIYD